MLKSDNIVKSYNMLLEAQFEKAVEFYKEKFVGKEYANKESAPCFDALDATAAVYLEYKDLPGVDEVELKKAIIHGSFLTSDNPNKIKAQLKIRINYNKAMISMFQEMLKTNYELLGFSKDVALILSQKLVSGDVEERKSSIKELKAAVLANKGKKAKSSTYYSTISPYTKVVVSICGRSGEVITAYPAKNADGGTREDDIYCEQNEN